MSTTELEKRLTAIELELAALKTKAAKPASSHPIHALEKIHGTFDNDEAFQEAMRLGRKWRKSDGRTAQKSKAKRK